MSFDVFLQRFREGDAVDADGETIAELLKPYLVDTGHGFPELRFGDGEAAIYGLENLASDFMVNHVSGRLAWDLLVEVARRVGLAIMPVGCPTAVPSEAIIPDLRDALPTSAVVVASGEELMHVIRTA